MREYTIQVYGLTLTLLVERCRAHFHGAVITRAQAASILRAQREHGARITRTNIFGGYR